MSTLRFSEENPCKDTKFRNHRHTISEYFLIYEKVVSARQLFRDKFVSLTCPGCWPTSASSGGCVAAESDRERRFVFSRRPAFRTWTSPKILRRGRVGSKTALCVLSASGFSDFDFVEDPAFRQSRIENCIFICLCARLFVSLWTRRRPPCQQPRRVHRHDSISKEKIVVAENCKTHLTNKK